MVKGEFRHARTGWVVILSLLPRATIAFWRAHLLIQAKLELLEYVSRPREFARRLEYVVSVFYWPKQFCKSKYFH